MPFTWPPFEFNPENFSLRNIQERYLDFGIVIERFDTIIEAVLVTILLALLAELLGIVIGLFVALVRLSSFRVLSFFAQAYVDVFRGTPLLVQLIIIYFTTPLIGLTFRSLFFAGLVALTLNAGAYVAEIFRGGIQSIDRGQTEAARASGLSYAQTMRHIIIPQAFRRVIPPLTNEFVMLIKDTSIVSVIGLVELLKATQDMRNETFNGTPLIAAALIYLAICLPLIYLANNLERRLNRRTA